MNLATFLDMITATIYSYEQFDSICFDLKSCFHLVLHFLLLGELSSCDLPDAYVN
jgi:hypothetical protein